MNHQHENGNKKKNMHKVIMHHVLILVGIAAAVGLFFLIRGLL